MIYASNLRGLKKRVNPDELGATVQGIRETRSNDLIVELKCSKKDRERLDTTIKLAVGASETVRHLIPRIEVEISDLDPSIEASDVEEAVRGFFEQDSEMEFRVSLTKTPYSGNKKHTCYWRRQEPWNFSRQPTSRLGGYPAGCAGERSSTGATAALALAIWQRTVAGQTAEGAAGDAVRKDIPRDPAPGNRNATSAPQERKSPGSITSRGQCVARLFGRQPPKGGRKKPQELS